MSLLEESAADCPYCGEPITLLIDTSCEEQTYVEDCEVCCCPMLLKNSTILSSQLSLFFFNWPYLLLH